MVLNKFIQVEVAYATPVKQVIIKVDVPTHATIQTAIEKSGVMLIFPEIDLSQQSVGIFSKRRELTDVLCDGDRIEIYRPLLIDPKEARRLRAAKTKQ